MKKQNTFSVFALMMLFLTFVMPFYHVKADEATYYDLPAQTCIPYESSGNSTLHLQINNDSRLVVIEVASRWKLYAVSLINNTQSATSYACPIEPFSGFNSKSYNGTTYYYKLIDWQSSYIFNNDIPVYTDKSLSNLSDNSDLAYRLTYGDLAEDPAPPVEAGDLTFNYYTDFASSQSYTIGSLKSNRDTITWEYNNTSTSNIPLLDLKVDIRAVPTNYYASTEDALRSLGWEDLHLDYSYASDLGSYQINNMKVSYTWEQVIDNFKAHTNLPGWFQSVIDYYGQGVYNIWNNLYYAAGWVYQIRLNTWSGDYTGEWQTIYTVPAAPPDGQQQTINYYVNGTGITEPIYQTIQNINNQNNITNNTWYVNGAPVDVDESSEGESWLEKLVKMIWNFITSIFQFNDTDLTIPDWDLNIQNLKDNTGIFGQSIQAIDQIKLRFDALQDAQPVFSFPGFSLDNVQLVPSFSVNLNDVVEDMGLEGLHNTELVIMDGVVYLSLILFAKAQLERILKK